MGRKSPPLPNPLTLSYSLFCKQEDSKTLHVPKPRRHLIPRQGGWSGPLSGCCPHFIQPRMLQIPCRVPDSQLSQGPQPAEQCCPSLPPILGAVRVETIPSVLCLVWSQETLPERAENSSRECVERGQSLASGPAPFPDGFSESFSFSLMTGVYLRPERLGDLSETGPVSSSIHRSS